VFSAYFHKLTEIAYTYHDIYLWYKLQINCTFGFTFGGVKIDSRCVELILLEARICSFRLLQLILALNLLFNSLFTQIYPNIDHFTLYSLLVRINLCHCEPYTQLKVYYHTESIACSSHIFISVSNCHIGSDGRFHLSCTLAYFLGLFVKDEFNISKCSL